MDQHNASKVWKYDSSQKPSIFTRYFSHKITHKLAYSCETRQTRKETTATPRSKGRERTCLEYFSFFSTSCCSSIYPTRGTDEDEETGKTTCKVSATDPNGGGSDQATGAGLWERYHRLGYLVRNGSGAGLSYSIRRISKEHRFKIKYFFRLVLRFVLGKWNVEPTLAVIRRKLTSGFRLRSPA